MTDAGVWELWRSYPASGPAYCAVRGALGGLVVDGGGAAEGALTGALLRKDGPSMRMVMQ